MALPIVGKFFSKLYSDQRYRNMQFATFSEPAPNILADLNIPPYREMIEKEKQDIGGVIEQIFTRRNDSVNLSEKKDKETPKEKKKVWETIRDIFRKKN